MAEWLSLSDVAELLGVHPSTVRSWSDAGSFPVHRTQGGHRRFLRNEVDMWLQSQRTGGTSERDQLFQKALKTMRVQLSESHLNSEAWYAKLDADARDHYRQNSHTLLQGLNSFLSSNSKSAEAETRAIGYEYASRGRRYGLSVSDSSRALLFFRNILMESIFSVYEAASVQAAQAWIEMFRKVTTFTDQILIALLETYEAFERGNSR